MASKLDKKIHPIIDVPERIGKHSNLKLMPIRNWQHSDNLKPKETLKNHFTLYGRCVIVRLFFVSTSMFQILYLSCMYNKLILLLNILPLIIIFDGIYVFLRREGREFRWFSVSIAAYCVTTMGIVMLQIDLKYRKEDVFCVTNRTYLDNYYSSGCFHMRYSVCAVVDLMVVMFLLSIVYARVILPHSLDTTKDEIYREIAGYTSAAADIIDISEFLQREEIAEKYFLMKSIQLVFALSLVQFSISIAATKKRNLKLTGFRKLIDIVFATETWALILAILSQELPSFIVRMALFFEIEKAPFSFYFFVIKNSLVISLYSFRSYIIVKEQYHYKHSNAFF